MTLLPKTLFLCCWSRTSDDRDSATGLLLIKPYIYEYNGRCPKCNGVLVYSFPMKSDTRHILICIYY